MGAIRRGTAVEPPTTRGQRPPKSDRRSLRKGAKRETLRTRAPRPLWSCAPREVSSRISSVASAVSRCGTAGPPSTERWRSRRELVALLPQVIAGTRALLRTVICSMSLPTRTRAPGPGQVNPIAPSGHSCIPVTGFTYPVRRLTITLRIQLIPGRVGQAGRKWAPLSPRRVRSSRPVTWRTRSGSRRSPAFRRRPGPAPPGVPLTARAGVRSGKDVGDLTCLGALTVESVVGTDESDELHGEDRGRGKREGGDGGDGDQERAGARGRARGDGRPRGGAYARASSSPNHASPRAAAPTVGLAVTLTAAGFLVVRVGSPAGRRVHGPRWLHRATHRFLPLGSAFVVVVLGCGLVFKGAATALG